MIRKIIWFAMILIYSEHTIFSVEQPEKLQMSNAIKQYQQALKKLIAMHQELDLKSPMFTSGSLLSSTYQKIIEPYVLYIVNYAQVVSSEFVRKFPYYSDLHALFDQYISYENEVKKIIALFPKSQQKQAWDIFHTNVISVVQICYNIIQQAAYSNNFDDQLLQAAYQAYQLAWKAQTSTIQLSGVSSTADFQKNIIQNMQLLFSNAIKNSQQQLSQGMAKNQDLETFYTQLESYYQILYEIYLNSGDTSQASIQQSMIVQIQQQQKDYVAAGTMLIQAQTQATTAQNIIILDSTAALSVQQRIQTSIKNFNDAVDTYQSTQKTYANAQDVMGQNNCTFEINKIKNFNLLLRAVQFVWSYYLIDQSIQNSIDSYPSLLNFITGDNSVQLQDAVQSLQNLIGFCVPQSSYQNSIGALISTTTELVAKNLIEDAIQFAQNAVVQQTSDKNKSDIMLNLVLLQDVQTGLTLLVGLCQAMIDATSGSHPDAMAQAMTYAQALDGLFVKQKDLHQYIAHLPDALIANQTWVNLAAQFFVKANVATDATQAIKKIGTAKITEPEKITQQDLQTMKNNAQALWNQAQKFATAGSFAKASLQYQKTMQAYTKLSSLEQFAADQVAMVTYANYAKTRFVACSFASIVQSTGLANLGQINNIPTAYQANSYQLKIDTSILGSKIPLFLNTQQTGKTVTTLTTAQKQDLFQLISAYLVAQILQDQGLTFTDYYVDYTLTSVVQASDIVQAAIKQVKQYLNNFDKILVSSVIKSSDTLIIVLLANFPLAAVASIASSVSTAATYFSSAATLFAQGQQAFNFGGQVYYPGDDPVSAKTMLKNLGYTYLCDAQAKIVQASQMMQTLKNQLGIGAKSGVVATLPKGFSQSIQDIANIFISAQSLLYAQQNSAYVYFTQAQETDLATATQQEFLQLYQTQIDFLNTCLLGDPTAQDFQFVVTIINKLYVAWASMLNSSNDAAKITQINENIAKLYVAAGEQCEKFSYQQPEFANFTQYHYMTTAQYFKSAQLQYQSLKTADAQTQAQTLATKLNYLYYLACQQSLKLYLHVKQHGASYISTATSQASTVTFDQLLQDFANLSNYGSMDPNEQTLYETVQSLLINAGIVYSDLSGLSDSSQQTSQGSGDGTKAIKTDSSKQKVLDFLVKNNVMDKDMSQPLYNQSGVPEKIINLISAAYNDTTLNMASQINVFAAFNEILFSVVKQLYITDYLGATSSDTADQIACKTQEFLNEIQKTVSSYQNPSSGYVG